MESERQLHSDSAHPQMDVIHWLQTTLSPHRNSEVNVLSFKKEKIQALHGDSPGAQRPPLGNLLQCLTTL